MEHKETNGFPHLRVLGLPTLIAIGIILLAMFIFNSKAYSQSPKVKARQNFAVNHPAFSYPDTVLNTHTGLLYSIISQQFRPHKKQTFYIGVSLSSNNTMQYIPENSIRKVSLIWIDKMGPRIKY